MPQLVKRLAVTGALVALLTAPWAATIAQMQMPPMPFPVPKLPGKGTPAGRMAECPTLDKLKSNLRITEAEKAAWDAYVAALKSNARSLQEMRESMRPVRGRKLPEAYEAHVTASEARLTALKELKPTLIALYESLNDNQRKKADDVLLRMSCII
jgi:LTXXQ motif family protein